MGLRIQVYVQAGARTQVQMSYILACVPERDILACVKERDVLAGVQEWDILTGVQLRDSLAGVQLRDILAGVHVCVLTWNLILDCSVPC